jgi:hypothetical protein
MSGMSGYAALLFVFVVAPILARFFLRVAYRRAVRRWMQERGSPASVGPVPVHASHPRMPGAVPAVVSPPAPADGHASRVEDLLRSAYQHRRHVRVIHAAAGLAQLGSAALVLLAYVEPGSVTPAAFVLTMGLSAIPLLPWLWALLRGNPLAGAGMGWIAVLFGVPVGAALAVGTAALLDLSTPGMVLLSVVQLLVLGAGALGIVLLYLRARAWLRDRAALSPDTIACYELAFAAAAFTALVVGARGNVRAAAMLGAFAVYCLVALLGRVFMGRGAGRGPPLNLLLLRVFGAGPKAERLLRTLARAWSHIGGIAWIAGTDVASATIDPRGLFAFLTGRLRSHFVRSRADLDRILAANDTLYLDGSYRLRELACSEDTWRLAVERLAGSSGAVLMDLRGFVASNRGCIYELGVLARRVPFERVVFLIDASTDRDTFRRNLDEVWATLDPTSPNAAGRAIPLQVIEAERLDVQGIVRALLAPAVTGAAP